LLDSDPFSESSKPGPPFEQATPDAKSPNTNSLMIEVFIVPPTTSIINEWVQLEAYIRGTVFTLVKPLKLRQYLKSQNEILDIFWLTIY
jgi:hypothetical protein